MLLIIASSLYCGSLFAQSSLDFNVSNNTGCSPLVVTFSADTIQYTSFIWDFGDGSSSILSTPIHVYNNTGTYSVQLIATNLSGFADTVIKQNIIVVEDLPSADFVSSNTVVCQNDESINFINQSQNFTSCYWDFGDGTGSNQINPSHTYSSSGTYSVSLLVYNAAGCFNSKDLSNHILVNPKPSGIISTNTKITCDIDEVFNFSFSSLGVNNYLWQFGDGNSTVNSNPNYSYSNSGIYEVKLFTENSFGCKDTSMLIGNITVLDNPLPSIYVTDSMVCVPEFIHASTGMQNVSSLTWNYLNGQTTTYPHPVIEYIDGDTTALELNITYQNGCENSNSLDIIALPSPNPQYSMYNNLGCAPLAVGFTNLTQGNYLYSWQYGDSSVSSSSNPTHTYLESGIYNPILSATDANGCTSNWTSPGYVDVLEAHASFSTNTTAGCKPLQVEFICSSPGVSQVYWNFGDGNTSTDLNPVHVYNSVGEFDITLIIIDVNGCVDTLVIDNYISVGIEDVQINSQIVNGCVPFSVQFASLNTSGNYLWDFGDGNTSLQSNPIHTYNTPGTYTVSYNFTSSTIEECSQSIQNYATYVVGGGEVDFSVNQSVCPPYTASFSDSSSNAVAWLWDFGDGSISTNQNPTHIYSNPGIYNVSLTITAADGCTRSITKNYVVSFEPLLASPDAVALNSTLPTNVQFTANSTGATNFLWDFGDGSTSTAQNPLHTYTLPGPYSLSLTISNDTCSRTLNYPNISIGGGSDPLPGDSIIYDQSEAFSGCIPYTVQFNSPVHDAISYVWYFGTGDSSNLKNPTYIYNTTGVFDVVLITQDSISNFDTIIQPSAVNLIGLNADFSISNYLNCNTDSVVVRAIDSTAFTYVWNFGNGGVATGIEANHNYQQSDDYFISLRVSDTNGCEAFSNKIYASGLDISTQSDKVNVCKYDTISFSANYINNLIYQWDFGDGNISNQVNPEYTYSTGGIFLVTLTVTDSNGCIFNNLNSIQIKVYDPVANFSSALKSNNCSNGMAVFTNLSQNASSWYWDFGDGSNSYDEHPDHVYSGYGNYSISLTVSNYNCSSTFIDSTSIVFNDVIADFNLIFSDKCLPSQLQIENLSQYADSYTWNLGDGTFSTDFEPQHIYIQQPLDSIKLTVRDSFGCQREILKPVMDFIDSEFEVNITNGCSPLTVQFTNYSINYDSLSWYINDSLFSNLDNPNLIIEDEGYYTVMLLLYSFAGCVDTLIKDSLIYVSNPTAEYTTTDTALCKPALFNFVNHSAYAQSYIWKFGDGSGSVSEHPVHLYHQNGSYATSLIAISSSGCRDTFELNHSLEVNGPYAKFLLASTGVCEPKTVWFNDSSLNASHYFWDFGDGHTSMQSQPIHEYADTGNYNVTLIVTDTIGCIGSYEYPGGVVINDHSLVAYSVDRNKGCVPFEFHLNIPQNVSDSLIIDFGDGTIGSKYTTKHTYFTAGEYQMKFIKISEWGCIDTSFSDTITAIASPVSKFTVENNIGCAPLNVQFVNQSYNLQNENFLWTIDGSQFSNDVNVSHQFYLPGNHTIGLIVINDSLCADTLELDDIIQAIDNTFPEEVNVDFVTVNARNEIQLQWQELNDISIDYYNLYKFNSLTGVYDSIYCTKGDVKLIHDGKYLYTDYFVETDKEYAKYKIQGVSYCKIKPPIDSIKFHNSILLEVDHIDNDAIHLKWNKYFDCEVDKYELYRKDIITGNEVLVKQIENSIFSYVDKDFSCPQPFIYSLKAINLCGKPFYSYSNLVHAEPLENLSIQKVNVIRTTVIDNTFILTEWNHPNVLPQLVSQYNVLRSTDKINYSLIDQISVLETEYIDYNVNVQKQNYYYKILPVNICEVNAIESNMGANILLKADLDNEETKLKWSRYEEWKSGVSKYVIEIKDYNGNWKVIKVVDGNTLETEH